MTRWLQAARLAGTKLTELTEPPEPPRMGQVSEVLSVKSVLSDREMSAPNGDSTGIVSQMSQEGSPEIRNPTPPSAVLQSHGRDVSGNPKTWTGGAVTLAAWRSLSDWGRHGSTGMVWNGLTWAWEPMKAEKGKSE